MNSGNLRLLKYSLAIILCHFLVFKGIAQNEENANWIGDGKGKEYRPASVFIKEFQLGQNQSQVLLKIASLGIHDISINGHRVGEEWLNPVYTNFERTLYENYYDITSLLEFGQTNVIAVTLGNGFYNFQPKVNWRLDLAPWRGRPFFRASITDMESAQMILSTDSTWRFKNAAWLFNSIFLGETFDQRLLDEDTSDPELENTQPAIVMEAPDLVIKDQPQVGLSIADTLFPISAVQLNPQIAVFKFPRNISGITELNAFPMSAGQELIVRYGEQLDRNGLVATNNLSHVYFDRKEKEDFQTDRIIANGKDTLTFTNRFSYKGFQYVQVRSPQGINKDDIDIKAFVLTSTTKRISTMHSGSEILNALWDAANNSIQSNMMGVPLDCPTREKNGWTGDGHVIFQSAAFNFDVQEIFKKWLEDHQEAQLSNGLIPNVIPTGGFGYDNRTFDWTLSTVTIPWMHYLFYGDTTMLSDNYPMMQSFMDYWRALKRQQFVTIGIGDWKASSKSNVWFTTSSLYYDVLIKMAQISDILGFQQNRSIFLEEARLVREAIIARFFKTDEKTFGNGTQTDLAFGYFYDLTLSESNKTSLGKSIIDRIKYTDNKVEAGILGVTPLLSSLSEMGRADLALKLVTNEENMIWAHWLKSGNQTMFEGPGYEPGEWYGGSQNHMYFGSFNEWIARDLVGVNPSIAEPGFKRVDLKPHFVEDLGFVDWTFEAPTGAMQVGWDFHSTDEVNLEVSMPEGTNLFLHVPDSFRVSSAIAPFMEKIAHQVYEIHESNFSITLTKYDTLLDLQSTSLTSLFFDGDKIFTDLNANPFQYDFHEFLVTDIKGNQVHKKLLGQSSLRRNIILHKKELPLLAKGLLIGTLMNSKGETIGIIKFVGR